jgi:hypothetical protein
MDRLTRANPAARAWLWIAGAGFVFTWLVVFLIDQPWAVPATYSLFVPLILALGASGRWYQQGEKTAPSWAVSVGLLLIIGAGLADIVATLYHTPDLALEGNPFARLLLDRGTSLRAVFVFAGMVQALYLAMQAILWLAWCCHREAWLAPARQAPSFRQFLRQLGWKSLVPIRPALWPSAHQLLMSVAPVFLFPEALHRLYLALGWFGLVPWVEELLLILLLTLGGCAGMLGWLYVQYWRQVPRVDCRC